METTQTATGVSDVVVIKVRPARRKRHLHAQEMHDIEDPIMIILLTVSAERLMLPDFG